VTSPAVAVTAEAPAGSATMALRHPDPPGDLSLAVGTGIPAGSPHWEAALVLRRTLDAVVPEEPLNGSPNLSCTLSLPLPQSVAGYLPPVASSPWWFRAVEGGDPGASGALDAFSITVDGVEYPTDSSTPRATGEGGSTFLWVPEPDGVTGVDNPSMMGVWLRAAPNPFRSHTQVAFRIEGDSRSFHLGVFDVLGREVRALASGSGSVEREVPWDGRDDAGRRLAPGSYLVRLRRGDRAEAVFPITLLP
jgi:hypothetical protein